MLISVTRLRNLTTLRLHTSMDDICHDIEFIVGEDGMLTHHLPAAGKAIQPWLEEKYKAQYPTLFDGEYRQVDGNIELLPMTDQERKAFWVRFMEESKKIWHREPASYRVA